MLARPEDFYHRPMSLGRDTPERPGSFAVIDGNYVSARWPGDTRRLARAYRFAVRGWVGPCSDRPRGREMVPKGSHISF